jgi:predicted AAA+ superfamily ATPase
MNYFKRSIDIDLSNWISDTNRKPLLLRGARQVGKSSAVRQLSTEFEYYIEVNFEEHSTVIQFFEGDLTPSKICENLSVYFKTPIIAGKTLLFFDEIQSCPKAISSLRFFYEKYPELHVIAAGSLLEFALQNLPSFGVGRIRSVFMNPLSFNEFLDAIGEEMLLDLVKKSTPQSPLPLPLHTKLIELLKKFIVLGGMPEVIANYVKNSDLFACQQVLDDLLLTYKTDFSKYHHRVPELRILEVFVSVAQQAGGKFNYSKTISQANHLQIKQALDLLILAGLVIPVTHTSANGIPLGAEINPKKRKMIFFDTGLFQRILGLNIADLLFSNDWNVINKGAIAEQFAGLELYKSNHPYQREDLFYWSRESLNSNAELDYIISVNGEIFPLEVKASNSGSMQSMYIFLKEKNKKIGIRSSLENFSHYDSILVFPLYAIDNIKRFFKLNG